MSVIQQIQEKYAKLMAVVIAIALIIFVVMLAFENGGSLFRGDNGSTIGKVNGETIDAQSFQQKITQAEAGLKQQGYPDGSALRQQAIETAWESEVGRLLVNAELEKLGMQIGKKELGDILYGAGAPQNFKQSFTDPNTGIFDARMAKSQIDQRIKSATAEEKAEFNAYFSSLEFSRLTEKYTSLLNNSINYPKWLIEKQNADNSQIARLSYVKEFYSSIPDSSVNVTDKEIGDYINKHKDEYRQEENRSIAYVAFSALPTAEDSAATRQRLLDLKPTLDTITNISQFLQSQGVQNYYDSYLNGGVIQVPFKDSIFKIPTGSVYGPYLDGGSYQLAKLVGIRQQPDTVKVRHILVSTAQQNQQTGELTPVREDAEAKRIIDSAVLAIRSGANFDSVCAKVSEDGTKDKGGIYDGVYAGRMVPEFNEFIFGNPVGSKDVVKTVFGYHYIEILSAKGRSAAYKIAYLPVAIEASQETENNANNAAAQFASNSRNLKAFDANAEKLKAQQINKIFVPDITPTESEIQGLGNSRDFVKSIYDADKGEVVTPTKVGDNWVVAVVTEVNKKGTQSVAKARPSIEALLINHKKAEVITRKIGAITTLEAAATALGGKIIEPVDSLRLSGANRPPALARESKVIGAAFNPANNGKVIPQAIEGSDAVYVVRVDNVSTTSVLDANVAEQRKTRTQQAKMMIMQMAYSGKDANVEALKASAAIKDNRAKIY